MTSDGAMTAMIHKIVFIGGQKKSCVFHMNDWMTKRRWFRFKQPKQPKQPDRSTTAVQLTTHSKTYFPTGSLWGRGFGATFVRKEKTNLARVLEVNRPRMPRTLGCHVLQVTNQRLPKRSNMESI